MRYFVVIVILLGVGISTLVMANDVGLVTSLKEIRLEKDWTIVPADQLFRDHSATNRLENLWKKTKARANRYGESYKLVDVSSFGSHSWPYSASLRGCRGQCCVQLRYSCLYT